MAGRAVSEPLLFEMNEIASGPDLRVGRSGTFADNMSLPVHRWFRYSAGFSAEWAEREISAHAAEDDVILDPFLGSGTTVLAAQKAGRRSFGFEAHPFIHRIASIKVAWPGVDEDRLMRLAQDLVAMATGLRQPAPQTANELLLKCYSPDVLVELEALKAAYISYRESGQPDADMVWLALTAILRSCSAVGTAQWQYVLPNKRKAKVLRPFTAFLDKMAAMAADIRQYRATGAGIDAQVIGADIRGSNIIPYGKAGLVITSPPYPNNYDYADAVRLEMSFWGEVETWADLHNAVRRYLVRSCSQHTAKDRLQLEELLADPALEPIRPDLEDVCHRLAEIRTTKAGKKTYHTMIAAYFSDLAATWCSLRGMTRAGATVCFVIGDAAPYGVYVPVDDWLIRLAEAAGFSGGRFEHLRARNVKWKNRKHTVPLKEGRLWLKG